MVRERDLTFKQRDFWWVFSGMEGEFPQAAGVLKNNDRSMSNSPGKSLFLEFQRQPVSRYEQALNCFCPGCNFCSGVLLHVKVRKAYFNGHNLQRQSGEEWGAADRQWTTGELNDQWLPSRHLKERPILGDGQETQGRRKQKERKATKTVGMQSHQGHSWWSVKYLNWEVRRV